MVPAVKELFIATHGWAISVCKQTHSQFIPQELCLTHASLNSAEGFLSTSHPLETASLAWSTSTPCSRRSTVIPVCPPNQRVPGKKQAQAHSTAIVSSRYLRLSLQM